MAFRREIDDGARPVLREQCVDLRAVADVAAHEDMPGVCGRGREVAEISGISQLVEIHYGLVAPLEPVEHEVGADEAGPAGYQ
jgi:hypothetical protein